jgi:hypothetical protein
MKPARTTQQIKQNKQQYEMRHMPAAMVHGSGGVLLMMMTKLATQKTIKKHRITKSNAIKAPSLTTISNSKQEQKIASENNHGNKHPAPSTKLTVKIQYFQMRKMDQRRRQRNTTGIADGVVCNV